MILNCLLLVLSLSFSPLKSFPKRNKKNKNGASLIVFNVSCSFQLRLRVELARLDEEKAESELAKSKVEKKKEERRQVWVILCLFLYSTLTTELLSAAKYPSEYYDTEFIYVTSPVI